MSILVSKSEQADSLSKLKTDKLNTLTVVLIQEDLAPLPDTPVADLIAAEADFGGYARKTGVALTGPVVNDAGDVELQTPNEVFICDGTAPSNTIYGYAVVKADLSVCYWWEKFASAQPMANNLDVVSFVGRYNLPAPTSECVPTE